MLIIRHIKLDRRLFFLPSIQHLKLDRRQLITFYSAFPAVDAYQKSRFVKSLPEEVDVPSRERNIGQVEVWQKQVTRSGKLLSRSEERVGDSFQCPLTSGNF